MKEANQHGQNYSASTVTSHWTEDNYESHEVATIECTLEEIATNDTEGWKISNQNSTERKCHNSET